jgi:hypothetical protein
MISNAPIREPLRVDASGRLYWTTSWANWLMTATSILQDAQRNGVSANRPIEGLYVGKQFFDTTLGHPIWYDGSGWVDATGSPV